MSTQIKGTGLETNLQGYWSLNEVSGTRNDSTANANNLTDVNTVGSAAGKQALAGDFEADNDEYLTITDAAQTGLDISGNMSISAWLNAESLPNSNNRYYILGKDTLGAKSYYVSYDRDAGNNYDIFFGWSVNGTSGRSRAYRVTLTASQWYHLVITFNISEGRVRFYLDGALVQNTTTTAGGTVFNSTTAFSLGSSGDNNQTWDGLLDEVGIWNTILTDAQVTSLYNSGAGIPFQLSNTGNFFQMF